jgi:hypothetical protein
MFAGCVVVVVFPELFQASIALAIEYPRLILYLSLDNLL